MHIGAPQTKQHEGRHAFLARISIDNQEINFPESLWFSLRGDPSYEYPALSDAFLVGMLPIAMKLGESIHVEGQVSEQLAYGLQTYQSILNCWWPETFKRIEIDYAELVDRRGEIHPAGVGCCFSGGVDSFYTVLKHLPESQPLPGYQLTHALMFNRFDKAEDFEGEGTSSTQFYENYRPVLENRGISLLLIDTNLRQYRRFSFNRSEIVCSFNSILAACAHVMGNHFGRFIIPGHLDFSYADLTCQGSHPVMDHNLGTGQLQIIHHAEGKTSRTGKLKYMIEFSEVQQHLHGCIRRPTFNQDTGRILNCCKCRKCIRNLITLDILGMVESFISFPLRHDKTLYKDPDKISKDSRIFLLDILELAKKFNNKEWIQLLNEALRVKEKSEHEKQKNCNISFNHYLKAAFKKIISYGH